MRFLCIQFCLQQPPPFHVCSAPLAQTRTKSAGHHPRSADSDQIKAWGVFCFWHQGRTEDLELLGVEPATTVSHLFCTCIAACFTSLHKRAFLAAKERVCEGNTLMHCWWFTCAWTGMSSHSGFPYDEFRPDLPCATSRWRAWSAS